MRDVNTTPVVLFATVDHLGRVLELRDGARAVIWSLVTQPFGEQHALTGTTPFLGRYPGQWHQAETGFAHTQTGDVFAFWASPKCPVSVS